MCFLKFAAKFFTPVTEAFSLFASHVSLPLTHLPSHSPLFVTGFMICSLRSFISDPNFSAEVVIRLLNLAQLLSA